MKRKVTLEYFIKSLHQHSIITIFRAPVPFACVPTKFIFFAGEEPLDLSNVFYLAMDWKNNEKCKPYVMVQSKELVSFQLNQN